MTKWFYKENQTIKGPFRTEEIQKMISGFNDPQNTYLWSRGRTDWVSADRWSPIENSTDQSIADDEKTTTSFQSEPIFQKIAEPTVLIKEKTADSRTEKHNEKEKYTERFTEKYNEKYKVQLNFVDQLPMTKDELMAFAARVDDPSQIAIFDAVTKEWKEIYSFKDVVDKLGLTRRKHPRVPILAQFTGSSSSHAQFSARLVTISIGGLGLTDTFDLKIGDTVQGQITSPHFYSAVAIEAEVTYCGNDGYVGLKFTQINDDSQSLVTDYVKRFSHTE